jgi:hypothetical protein
VHRQRRRGWGAAIRGHGNEPAQTAKVNMCKKRIYTLS